MATDLIEEDDPIHHVDFLPRLWYTGCDDLSCLARGAYITICAKIWMSETGWVDNDDKKIAGWCKLTLARWRKVKTELIAERKLTVDGDRLTNKRALKEFKIALKRRQKAIENGRKGGQKSASQKQKKGRTPPDSQKSGQATLPARLDPPLPFPSLPKEERETNSESSGNPALAIIRLYDRLVLEIFGSEYQRHYPHRDDLGMVKGWLAKGASQDQIEGVFVSVLTKLKNAESCPFKSLRRLDNDVQQALKDPPQKADDVDLDVYKIRDDEWSERMRVFRTKIYDGKPGWSRRWGPKPGEEGCLVPPHLLD